MKDLGGVEPTTSAGTVGLVAGSSASAATADESVSTKMIAMESEERRLHPTSPLFVLGGSLRQFAIPLVVLLLTGRGDRNEFISAIVVGLLALHSIAQYFTFRFRIDPDGVVIRSGVTSTTR